MLSQSIFAKHALLSTGWHSSVLFEVDCNGVITQIKPDSAIPHDFSGKHIDSAIIPGMVNNHSHAFQWAMAGLAEHSGDLEGETVDSFWTWRKAMYQFVERFSSDDLEVVATALYLKMLQAGYTSVGEFHYLHHDRDGRPFDYSAEMSKRLFQAADTSGIDITLLPVFYRYSGFGQQAANEGQKRFINDHAQYKTLLTSVAELAKQYDQNFGIAPHSLRAVDCDDIQFALETLNQLDNTAPIHIHIAEQQKEVDDCLAFSGKRPIEYLQEKVGIDSRWCLVHATHMTHDEISTVAQSGAVVSICTTTEANLGDGIFPFANYRQQQGKWSIGSDSHISVNATEELRWLEYQQRLLRQERTCIVGGSHSSNGETLWQQAAQGGAQSLNQAVGELAVGKRANFIELDEHSLLLAGKTVEQYLDAVIFNQQVSENLFKSVWVRGEEKVSSTLCETHKELLEQAKETLQRLTR